MKETVEQYIARITGMVGNSDPMAVLESTAAKIAETVKSLSDEQTRYKPSPDKWSIRQIVAHLVDSEMVLNSRVRWAASEPGKAIVAYDQDKWAATSRYPQIPVGQSLETFTVARKWMVQFLRQLTPAEREGYIQHEERGKETLAHLLKMIAGHDLNHLKQIAELAQASASQASAARS